MGRRLREKLSLLWALRHRACIGPSPSDERELKWQTHQGEGQTGIRRGLHIEAGLDICREDRDKQEDNTPRSPHTQTGLRAKDKSHSQHDLDDPTQGNERFVSGEVGWHRAQVHLGIHEVIDPSSDIEEGTEVEPDEVKAITKHRNV